MKQSAVQPETRFRFRALASLAVAGLCLTLIGAGCRSATYVDSAGPRTIVTLDDINIQDWNEAADRMIDSLLASGVLERAPEQPSVMAVSRISNHTSIQVDTNMLTGKIRRDLNQSGKVLTTTTIGLGGRVEDPLAQTEREFQEFMEDRPSEQRRPYFTLSGRIMEDQVQAGRTRQATYIFQLAMTEITSGLAVWEDEVMITKQGTRPAIGW
jgi:penicillin-binding protein activator